MNKITSINGTLLTPLNELNEHTGNKAIHVTEDERITWNAKADASTLSTKTDTSAFDAHTNDTVVHITAKERETWDGKQDKLTDESGNMTLSGRLTTAATINANGGINIPVTPSTDTEAARFREVKLLDYIQHAAFKTIFHSSSVFPFGVKLDSFNWQASGGALSGLTVARLNFSALWDFYLNSSYTGVDSILWPVSIGFGRVFCWQSLSIGNTDFNTDYMSLNGEPFTTPAAYMKYWFDVRFGDMSNAQRSATARLRYWDHKAQLVVSTSATINIPSSFNLRYLAFSCRGYNQGVWLVGVNLSGMDRPLVAYRLMDATFPLDSYNEVFVSSKASLATDKDGIKSLVRPLEYYPGDLLAAWCRIYETPNL